MTTAYLFHNDCVLLMKRSSEKSFIPDAWSGIGGHVEPDEHTDLLNACLREVEEETGLQPAQVNKLSLRYVLLRQRDDELRQQFVYFGTTTTDGVGITDEGTLHWIPCSDIFDREMTDSNRLMLKHYFENVETHHAWVGTLYGSNGQPQVHWAQLSDWE